MARSIWWALGLVVVVVMTSMSEHQADLTANGQVDLAPLVEGDATVALDLEVVVEEIEGDTAFDGVHVGHQTLFCKTAELALAHGGTSVAFTFEPHPLKIIAPGKAPPLLTHFKKKMEW